MRKSKNLCIPLTAPVELRCEAGAVDFTSARKRLTVIYLPAKVIGCVPRTSRFGWQTGMQSAMQHF